MYSLNLNGKLLSLEHPIVMGIINITPDSFYDSCKSLTEQEVTDYAAKALEEGATLLDIGGYSSRPNAQEVSMEEEWRRVDMAAGWIRKHFPDAILSVDTFRAEIAHRAACSHGVQIINDISGGELDKDMFRTIAQEHTAYILMHMRGTPQTMQQHTDYTCLTAEIIDYFQQKIATLHQLGVADIVIDPGFGFAKTSEQNYELLRKLSYLTILECPILAGISRKSMIYKALHCSPQEALNGTTALHMLALQNGANILRVHDVKAAVEAITLYQLYTNA
ncbi:MAG: dihydropteroate synthase [Paludibacter sp.]|nr:dihydropteroate synthase [Bacteroidales bacterium]MCM1068471.1 dihydropteroate synthase [Prevotella sp.]MCM1353425.1 dihydropteroate synthase [Bacteroides sp.]MCM1442586.1 dihydropteroate synthase [Muribaculum sp.]MCM1481431.1 dihydropteroate synthase [Paludibacter sp.]